MSGAEGGTEVGSAGEPDAGTHPTTDADPAIRPTTDADAAARSAGEPDTGSAAPLLHSTDTHGITRITLNRPNALNALTPAQRNEIIALLEAASSDPHVRVVVLTGTGRGFCAGADLRGGTAREVLPGDVARTLRMGAQRLIAAVLDCEKPVIAAVNGTAAGLGAHLAFACDLVIAAESARFIEVFVRRGLVPDGGGAYLLPRLIGVHRAKELMFFGDSLSAPEAERVGLVNKVVPDGELAKSAQDWASRLATAPTRSLALTKHLLNTSLDSDRSTAFAAEAAAQEINMTTADAREGLRAFAERRSPEFRGR